MEGEPERGMGREILPVVSGLGLREGFVGVEGCMVGVHLFHAAFGGPEYVYPPTHPSPKVMVREARGWGGGGQSCLPTKVNLEMGNGQKVLWKCLNSMERCTLCCKGLRDDSGNMDGSKRAHAGFGNCMCVQ